jgi:hypothetical protein
MPLLTRAVSSLPDFIKQILSVQEQWQREDDKEANEAKKHGDEDQKGPLQIWFRGQANASWKLVPNLYRLKQFNENEIRTEFKLRAFQLMPEGHVPKNDKEWYFLMQHFRAPTRLLDWTDSALIALYFAVRDQKRYRNAAVWMLDPEWFNAEVFKRVDPDDYTSGVLLPDWSQVDEWIPEPFERALHIPLPIAVDPPHVARRLSVQRSRFTIHGKSKRGLDVLASGLRKTRLVKILVLNNVGKEILKNLSTCGIVETSVFPDLEGLSRELGTKWTQIKPQNK